MYSDFSMIVLAGGNSTRMGKDKAMLTLNGKTFLEVQIEKGRALGITDILVSGDRAVPEGVRCVPDRVKGAGPLGGLEACLSAAEHPKSLVVTVDMPLVPMETLHTLLDLAKTTDEPVIITRSEDGAQPLIGVYDRSIVPVITEQLKASVYRVFGVLNQTGYREFVPLPNSIAYSNINTQKDYQNVLANSLK